MTALLPYVSVSNFTQKLIASNSKPRQVYDVDQTAEYMDVD